MILLFQIKSLPVDRYESVAYKRVCNINLRFSKHKEITFSHGFFFPFMPYFIGAMLTKKCQKWVFGEKDIKRGRPYIGGLSIEGGFKPSAHYASNCVIVLFNAEKHLFDFIEKTVAELLKQFL